MRIFILKAIIIFFGIFFLYNLTIGVQIKNFKNLILSVSNKDERVKFKNKLIFEMGKGIKKESYFNDEEKAIVSSFIKKILNELDLKN